MYSFESRLLPVLCIFMNFHNFTRHIIELTTLIFPFIVSFPRVQLGSVIRTLERIEAVQRCILTEEIDFLQKCLEMLNSGEQWAKGVLSDLPGLDLGNKSVIGNMVRVIFK